MVLLLIIACGVVCPPLPNLRFSSYPYQQRLFAHHQARIVLSDKGQLLAALQLLDRRQTNMLGLGIHGQLCQRS